jgi:Glycosyl transferase family 11
MIRLLLSGGLGNQLFEYATARAISIRNGVPIEIDLRFYSKDTLGTQKGAWLVDLPVKATFKHYDNALLSPHNPVRRGFEKVFFEAFHEICFDKGLRFNPHVPQLGRNAVLVGFFQCYKYFEREWPAIAPELDMSCFVDSAWIDQMVRKGGPWCAVHLRRGDYVGDSRFEMRNPEQYYSRAMDLVRLAEPNTRFVVFSDDIAWCRLQLFLQGCNFYEGSPIRHPAVDLATMARASSNIIGNSSYSWWAAWILHRPGKLVVAPSIWVDGLRTADLQILPDSWSVV